MPTLSAAFVDENLPDGTHLQPGTKFIKHWRMKNTGNVKWNGDTKVFFFSHPECKDVIRSDSAQFTSLLSLVTVLFSSSSCGET